MSSRVRVCIRIRPIVCATEPCDFTILDTNSICLANLTKREVLQFDHVLGTETNQASVYSCVVQDLVENVLEGYNGSLIAYGQTGSGKTYTISGKSRVYADRGVSSRAIAQILGFKKENREHAIIIRMSYLEVYNEQVYDLLNLTEDLSATKMNLLVQEDKNGETIVKGLTRPIVESEEEAYELLFQGETARCIAEHCLNNASTRSHCIFTVYIEKKNNEMCSTASTTSKLHIVDLAGSERMKKTNATGTLLKEATHINKSLTFLEQVVVALGERGRNHIPYRQSLLTNILKDSLGGNSKTVMIACIWSDKAHSDQTLATLKFATRMRRVKTTAVINNVEDLTEDTQRYKQRIKLLQEELMMYDTLTGRTNVPYAPLNKTQQGEVEMSVQNYIDDESQVPLLQSVAQILQVYTILRKNAINCSLRTTNTPEPAIKTLSSEVLVESPSNFQNFKPIPTIEPFDKEALFQQFVQGHGKDLGNQYDSICKNLKVAKKNVAEAIAVVNRSKSKIDSIVKSQNESEPAQASENGLIQQIKEEKQNYKACRKVYQELDSEMQYLRKLKASQKEALLQAFKAQLRNA